MPRTAAVAAASVGNVATAVAGGRLRRQQTQRHFRDHAEGSLAADQELHQRQPGAVLEPQPAEPDRGAVGEHDLQAMT